MSTPYTEAQVPGTLQVANHVHVSGKVYRDLWLTNAHKLVKNS